MRTKKSAIRKPTLSQLIKAYPVGSMVSVHNRSFVVKRFFEECYSRSGKFGQNRKYRISVQLGRPHMNGIMQKAGCATEFEKEVVCNGFATKVEG